MFDNVPEFSKHYEASEQNSIFLWLKIEQQKPVPGNISIFVPKTIITKSKL